MVDLGKICPQAPTALREVVSRLVRPGIEDRLPDALALVGELERIGGFSRFGRTRVHADLPTVGWSGSWR